MLVVCEGAETEPNYFDGLKRDDAVKRKFSVNIKGGNGGSVEAILNRAIDLRENSPKKFDEVWVIADIERGLDRESLERAIRRADEEGVYLCLSNPCFEVWVLAHFTQKTRAFNDCDAVVKEVGRRKHWRGYDKGDEAIYRKLKDKTERAISNAEKGIGIHRDTFGNSTGGAVDFNSSTEVYIIVSQLLG